MADDNKFDFDLNELATDQETAQDEELRRQVRESAGNILAAVKKLANKGDINNLRRIERSLTEAPEPRRGSREDTPREPRTRHQPTPPSAPATEQPDDDNDATKPKGRLAKLAGRFNQ
jgi:hypothetical protein